MFEIGDRVHLLVDHPYNNPDLSFGETGTVCAIIAHSVGVRWDKKIYVGHTCDGFCEDGYGWWVRSRDIQLLNKIQELNPIPENDFLEMLG